MRPYTNLYVSERYTANRQNNPDSPTAKGANNSLLEGEKRLFTAWLTAFRLKICHILQQQKPCF